MFGPKFEPQAKDKVIHFRPTSSLPLGMTIYLVHQFFQNISILFELFKGLSWNPQDRYLCSPDDVSYWFGWPSDSSSSATTSLTFVNQWNRYCIDCYEPFYRYLLLWWQINFWLFICHEVFYLFLIWKYPTTIGWIAIKLTKGIHCSHGHLHTLWPPSSSAIFSSRLWFIKTIFSCKLCLLLICKCQHNMVE